MVDCGGYADHGEEEKYQPQKDIGDAQAGDRVLFKALVLLLAEGTVGGPLRQEIAGTQGLFARFRVDSHAGLPKRRAIWTSITIIAIAVSTK